MTWEERIAELRARVEAIAAAAARGDHEAAHSLEDQLRGVALRLIVRSVFQRPTVVELREIAAIALSTDEIEFDRWCS